MTAENGNLTDERLWDAIEDVLHWIKNDGADLMPPVLQDKVFTIIAATKRNDRVHSIEMGTAGKGGVVKVYVDPLDMETSNTVLENIYVLRQEMQEKHKLMDINPQR